MEVHRDVVKHRAERDYVEGMKRKERKKRKSEEGRDTSHRNRWVSIYGFSYRV